jgi:hypothetical protein
MANFDGITKKIPGFVSVVISLAVFLVLCFLKSKIGRERRADGPVSNKNCVIIFIQESCHHCHELKKFCESIDMSKYSIGFYDIADRKNFNLFLKHIRLHKAPISQIGTPAIFSDIGYMVGFDRSNGDDAKFQELLDNSKFSKYVEKTKGKAKAEKLSLKFVSLTVLREIFGFNNFYIFMFLYLILVLCNFNKNLIITCCYFGFSIIIDFLLLTKNIDIFLLDRAAGVLLLSIGYFCLLFAASRILEEVNYPKNFRTRTRGPIPAPILFAVSLLTILANFIKFLNPSNNWQKYELVLDENIANFFLYHSYALFSTFFYSIVNISITSAVLIIFVRHKDSYINNLTIVEGLLLLVIGIFIIFI